MSRGPVYAAYADTDALSRPCPLPKGCGAVVNEWCVMGPQRLPKHIPCVIRTRTTPEGENGVPGHSDGSGLGKEGDQHGIES